MEETEVKEAMEVTTVGKITNTTNTICACSMIRVTRESVDKVETEEKEATVEMEATMIVTIDMTSKRKEKVTVVEGMEVMEVMGATGGLEVIGRIVRRMDTTIGIIMSTRKTLKVVTEVAEAMEVMAAIFGA